MKTRALAGLFALMVLLLGLAAVAWQSTARRSGSATHRPAAHHPMQRRAIGLAMPADGPYLHTDGAALRDASGHAVRLSGINWFGLETCAFAPDGLNMRSWGDLLDQVRALGYNTIRLPFSDQLLDPGSRPLYIDYGLNPDLRGLTGLQIMDRVIAGAGARGLRIILDRHRPDCGAQSSLWYTPRYPERRWIADLVYLAKRYRHQPTVIGVDLHNEPHDAATWGDGNPWTDWRLAAERAGDAVLRANPHLLIFVEGVQTYHHDIYWWGGNLQGVAAAPVRLAVPHRLVYEAHDYGPGVYWQGWFSARDFPRNLPQVWDTHWGYVQQQDIAPVVLGEFGGRNSALTALTRSAAGAARQNHGPLTAAEVAAADGLWQRALISYLSQRGLSFLYWNLTPDSVDTGGLLNDDWQSANATKQALLKPLQGAPLPVPGARPAPAPLRVLASDTWSPGDNQQRLFVRLVNDGPRPLSLATATVRYWTAAVGSGQTAYTGDVTGTNDLTGTGEMSATNDAASSLDPGMSQDAPDGQRTATIDWASTGMGTVAVVTGTVRGSAYVEMRFTALPADSSVLAPYGGAATIVLRLHRTDWYSYDPQQDWSYTSSVPMLVAPHFTLLLAGHPAWGLAPPSVSPWTGQDKRGRAKVAHKNMHAATHASVTSLGRTGIQNKGGAHA